LLSEDITSIIRVCRSLAIKFFRDKSVLIVAASM
jgi:hypothetical protein